MLPDWIPDDCMVPSLPAVSCACLTYGRPHLLEEAIYCFLQQDYAGCKELIVLNDYPQQTLVYDSSEVTIINAPVRFRTLGEKINAAFALCSYDLIFVWDDDDIYLPHRLSFSVQHFDPSRGFFKADKAWLWDNGVLSGPMQNIFHAGACLSRDVFNTVRGYGMVNNGYDQEIEAALAQSGVVMEPYIIERDDIYYIYRWGGTGSYHVSGYGEVAGEYEEVAATVVQQVARGELAQGHITLTPHWKLDYGRLVAEL